MWTNRSNTILPNSPGFKKVLSNGVAWINAAFGSLTQTLCGEGVVRSLT